MSNDSNTMRNIRIVVIGFMVGGAVGAKIGAYLYSLLGMTPNYLWVESGMIAGGLIGILGSVTVIVAMSIPSKEAKTSSASPAFQ